MIEEVGLAPILAAAAGLMGGVVLLAGLAGGAYVTATTTGAECRDASPSPHRSEPCGLYPDVAMPPLEVRAGSERGLVAVQAALLMRGVPYSWGGGDPNGPSYGIGHGTYTHMRASAVLSAA